MDPWYPLGDGNLIRVADFGLHVCHMTGYNDIMTGLNLVTTNGAKTLKLEGYGIEEGNDASFVVIDCTSDYDAIRCSPNVLYSVRKGNVIASTKPVESTLHVDLYKQTIRN